MRNVARILVLTALMLVVVAACRKAPTEVSPDIAASDEQLYKLGEQWLKKDPERARLYMRQVIDSFPKSYYAQRAKLAIANSYFDKGDESNMILAAAEYRDFINSYPFSPSASFAQYRVGLTYSEKANKPGRDQTKTLQALAEFKKVLTAYPLSEEAKQAQAKIKGCEENLAEHYFIIARHYYKVRAYKASTSRLLEILTNYPSYSQMAKVYFYLADSYLRWSKVEESVPYFTKLASDYPRSSYGRKAAEQLKEIESARSAEKK